MEGIKTIEIKCPFCKQPVSIMVLTDVESMKKTCPHCQKTITIRFNKKDVRMDSSQTRQQSSGGSSDGERQAEKNSDETELGNVLINSGKPFLVIGNQRFQLKEGRNTVGRRSDDSTATLQIPTDDLYMSRVNAIIEISKVTGNKWYVTVSSCNERNLVKVNQRTLKMGERLVLQPSYVIRLGHTDVGFTLE